MRCQPRCERLTLGKSDLEGFDLLVCAECQRPIKVKVRGKGPRVDRPKRGDRQRALRAARRSKLK